MTKDCTLTSRSLFGHYKYIIGHEIEQLQLCENNVACVYFCFTHVRFSQPLAGSKYETVTL